MVLIGLAVIFGLCALIPSKQEQSFPVPWASISLAVLSGISVMLSGLAK